MDHLAVGVALCVQVPPRSEKGGPRGRDGGHFSKSADRVLHRLRLTMTSVLPRKGDKECDKVIPATMRGARDEELFRGQYY